VLAPALRALSPFDFISPSEKLSDFNVWQFVPFWAFFRNINLSTFRNVFEAAVYYVPIGYALVAMGRRPTTAFLAALVLAEVLEVLQIGVAGRTFDITEGIYAGTGALLGAYVLAQLHERLEAGMSRPRLGAR
jgi:glycopeptide antibiotics resistance protein